MPVSISPAPGAGRPPRPHALRFRLARLACAAAFFLAGPAAVHAATAGAGWDDLWHNRVEGARGAFEARLAVDPGDVDARRGLVLALVARGHERAALAELRKQAELPGAGVADFLLADWLDRLVSTSGADDRTLQVLYQKLAERPELDPLDRRAIQAQALDKAILNADARGAERLAVALNRLNAWSLLGPFDNTSGSALDRDDLGTGALTTERRYVGRGRLPISWIQAPYLNLARQVIVRSHFPLGENLAVYAGLTLQVYQPGVYLLSVSRVGGLLLRLDGQELLRLDDGVAQDELDQFEVTLPAGRHTLLAKICQEDGAGALAVGLSMPDGKPAGGIGVVPLAPGTLQEGTVAVTPRPLPCLAALERGVAADSTNAGLAFERLLALDHYQPRHEARAFAQAMLRRFPDSALHRVAATALLARLGDRDQLHQRIERALAADSANAPGLLMAAQEAFDRKLYTRVDSLLGAVTRPAADCLSGRLLQLAAYQRRGMQAEGRALAEDLVREAPDFSTPYEALADAAQALGDKSRARQYRKQASARLPRSFRSLNRLLRAAREEDSGEQARSLEELVAIYRDSAVLRAILAQAQLADGNADGLQLADETALKFPYSAEAQLLKAQLEDLRTKAGGGSVNTALPYLERVQLLDPGNLYARDRARQIRGLRPLKEVLPVTDLATVRARPFDAARYPGAGAVILLDERRRIVLEDGTSYAQRSLSVRLLTAEGVEAFGSLPVEANPYQSDMTLDVAQTVKPDGTLVDAEQGAGAVAFRSLAPGDVIELQYGASGWSDPTLNAQFWDVHGFQWAWPCQESRYTLLLATGRTMEWKMHNAPAGAPEPTVETHDGFESRTWVMKEMPARPREPLAPGWRDASPWLDVSTVGGWGDIARWYAGLSDGPSRVDPQVEARARELTATDFSRDARVRRLFDFVTNRVAYENLDFQYSALVPAAAPAVLDALYGDCKDKVCLLRSLLAAVEIPAWFVLVTPNDEGVAPFLPSPRFTHAILALEERPGQLLFLDPTARGTPFGALPGLLEGCQALVVRPETTGLTELGAGQGVAGTRISTEMTLASERALALKRREVYRAADDVAGLRGLLGGEDETGRRGTLAADLGSSLVGLKLNGCDWSGLGDAADSLVLGYEAEASPGVTSTGALRIVRLPWRSRLSARVGAVIGATERSAPLDMSRLRADETEQLLLRLPSGWSLAGVPDPVALEGPFGSVEITFAAEKGALRGRRHLRLPGGMVPAADYARLREFLGEVVKALEISLVLQAPPAR